MEAENEIEALYGNLLESTAMLLGTGIIDARVLVDGVLTGAVPMEEFRARVQCPNSEPLQDSVMEAQAQREAIERRIDGVRDTRPHVSPYVPPRIKTTSFVSPATTLDLSGFPRPRSPY